MSTNDRIIELFQQGVMRMTFQPSTRIRGGVALVAEQAIPTESGALQILHNAETLSAADCLNKVSETVAHCAEKKAHIARPPDGSIISMPGGN